MPVSMGHEAVSASHLGMTLYDDRQIVEHARAEGWYILTRDKDYGNILAEDESTDPTVILLRIGNPGATEMTNRVREVLQEYPEDSFRNRIVVIGPRNVRFRDLPIHPRESH